ncbi:MAG TPA: hypothetical protein PLQ35_05590 [bacterium]|nr:hypothetical protein [bacterium]HQL61749.1 hypothetical protein [bacterium]
MDKRRLFENIALTKKRIFALTTFAGFSVVCVATIYGKGIDFLALFVNSAVAVIVFGLLGLGTAVLYERLIEAPLINSYREEARQRIRNLQHGEPEMLEMEVPVSDLRAGMAVCQQVDSAEGALLVRPGAILTDRLILTLQENGIERVRVKAQRSS